MFSRKQFQVLLLVFTIVLNFSCDSAQESSDPAVSHETGTVTDIDGNVYKTIIIGNQEWTSENLKVTKYRNGEDIPNLTDNKEWSVLSTGAYAVYDNLEENSGTYGYLYNFYAVMDTRNLAPEGWHVSTDDDWKELEMYLGMSEADVKDSGYSRGTEIGAKLKKAGKSRWNSERTEDSGFSALPAGSRSIDGKFNGVDDSAYFWSLSDKIGNYALYRSLFYRNSDVQRIILSETLGFSVRLVRDR